MITKNVIGDLKEVKFREDIQIVRINGKFDSSLIEDVEKKVSKAHNIEQPVIPFVIDSPGGEIPALMSIYETVERSEIPVITYLKGKALSAGLVMLGFGEIGHRYASPHGTGMLHEMSWGKREKLSELEKRAEFGRKQNDYIFKELADHAGVDEDYYLDLMYEKEQKNADKWMTAKELREHSLVDVIGAPKLTRTVEVEWDFEQQIVSP